MKRIYFTVVCGGSSLDMPGYAVDNGFDCPAVLVARAIARKNGLHLWGNPHYRNGAYHVSIGRPLSNRSFDCRAAVEFRLDNERG